MDLLQTEQRNEKTRGIDSLPTTDILRLINQEDHSIADAVEAELPQITEAVDGIVNRLNSGGRLIYIGAGTSGRLGVLDASECPPTFGVPPDMVQAIIAGGYEALYKAVESGEDFSDRGVSDLQSRGLTAKDAVVGIAASGRTPYTIGALNYAREIGALTIAVTCNPDSPITKAADISIVPATGPEAIAGSTRMKAGTAQKMVLNLLSTAAMVRLGYVYDNLMSNVQPTNEKLRWRAAVILSEDSGLSKEDATMLLDKANNNLRAAMIMHKTGVDYATALDALSKNRNIIRAAIETITRSAR
jgi:N-acetylmuramic acid 6-phosphate etherase